MVASRQIIHTIVWVFFLVVIAGVFPQLLLHTDHKKELCCQVLYACAHEDRDNKRIADLKIPYAVHVKGDYSDCTPIDILA